MMSFTFLGYIHISPISITFAYIPILMTACILGTMQSTVMGAIFSLASMYKATAFYTLTEDMMFSPTFSGNPFGSFAFPSDILSLMSRTDALLYRAKENGRACYVLGDCDDKDM